MYILQTAKAEYLITDEEAKNIVENAKNEAKFIIIKGMFIATFRIYEIIPLEEYKKQKYLTAPLQFTKDGQPFKEITLPDGTQEKQLEDKSENKQLT